MALIILTNATTAQSNMDRQQETITLGAGCFWCVEAIFESIPGVISAQSGYAGGHIKNPAYREVCQVEPDMRKLFN